MKKYRVIEGGRLDKLLKNGKGLAMIATASIILAGLSAATLAFAAEPEPTDQPEEPAAISYTKVCEEVNTEPELVSLGEFTITHYCPCSTCCGIWSNPENPTTASGARAEAGKTIAVDPDVIPWGTEVVIDGHTYTAQDSGSLIQGNRIDIYCDSHDEANQRGIFTTEVFLKGGAA